MGVQIIEEVDVMKKEIDMKSKGWRKREVIVAEQKEVLRLMKLDWDNGDIIKDMIARGYFLDTEGRIQTDGSIRSTLFRVRDGSEELPPKLTKRQILLEGLKAGKRVPELMVLTKCNRDAFCQLCGAAGLSIVDLKMADELDSLGD